jgi:sulfatase modifying factor 1
MGGTCIDRWEVHTVDVASMQRLSPFYPPEANLLRKVHDFWSNEASRTGSERARRLPLPLVPSHQRESFKARAVSAPGVLPQGYMTYYSARDSCAEAGKRLCSSEEWARACRGKGGTKHPYGSNFRDGQCNVFREIHPAYELHGNSSLGHLDPRLHLVVEEGKLPLLLETGEKSDCSSRLDEGTVFDMVGNLDEWIDDPDGTFVGGFFSRQTREGCEARIENHAPAYTDYSIGTRCCKDAR